MEYQYPKGEIVWVGHYDKVQDQRTPRPQHKKRRPDV